MKTKMKGISPRQSFLPSIFVSIRLLLTKRNTKSNQNGVRSQKKELTYMYHKLKKKKKKKKKKHKNMFLQLFCQNTQLNILTIKLKN